jgi:hypothetical protein
MSTEIGWTRGQPVMETSERNKSTRDLMNAAGERVGLLG